MLILLILVTFLFLLINFMVTKGDYMHPSFLLSALLFIYELFCLSVVDKYAIVFNHRTFIVLFIAQFIFFIITLFGMVISKKRQTTNSELGRTELTPIVFGKGLSLLTIGMQLVVIFFFIRYLRNVAGAAGVSGGLSNWIATYDGMIKFAYERFVDLRVSHSFIYKLLEYPADVLSYFAVYVLVNNYLAVKKVNRLHLVILLLMLVRITLTGSRSPMLRILTMVIMLFYVLYNRKVGKRTGDMKTLLKLLGMIAVTIPFLVGVLSLMGRSTDTVDMVHYVFLYTGAPLLNLNNYLETFTVPEASLIAEQTLRGFYVFLYSRTGNLNYRVVNIIGNSSFVSSANGIGTGNVLTAFYVFMYDLGYIGVLVFSTIMASYYIPIYNKVTSLNQKNRRFDFNMFFYAYLFNDLVMLPFSNRFFETTVRESFFRFWLVAVILYLYLYSDYFKKYRIKLKLR